MEQSIYGAWSLWSFNPTKEALQVFEETLGKCIGVKYNLVAFAKQIVNGTNYEFLCEVEATTYPSHDYVVMANVHQPLEGYPYVLYYKIVGPLPALVPGGWQDWDFSVKRNAETVFHNATKGLIGVHYAPLAVTKQIVAGMTYCYLCKASSSVLNPSPYPVLIYIFQPIQGEPYVQVIDPVLHGHYNLLDTGGIPFTIAKNYFIKNTVSGIDHPKIETAEEFDAIFGMATVSGKNGKPTEIDFSKQYVIALMHPATDYLMSFHPVSLQKNISGEIVLTYRIHIGEKQTSYITPFLALVVDKSYNGNVVLKQV